METMIGHDFCGLDLVLTNLTKCLLSPIDKSKKHDPRDMLLKGMIRLRDIIVREHYHMHKDKKELRPIIKLAIRHIEDKEMDVRNAAQDLIMELFKIVGFEAIEPEFQGTLSV